MLDVGCGTGWFSRRFAAMPGLHVTGVDVDAQWLEFARGRDARSAYSQGGCPRLALRRRQLRLCRVRGCVVLRGRLARGAEGSPACDPKPLCHRAAQPQQPAVEGERTGWWIGGLSWRALAHESRDANRAGKASCAEHPNSEWHLFPVGLAARAHGRASSAVRSALGRLHRRCGQRVERATRLTDGAALGRLCHGTPGGPHFGVCTSRRVTRLRAADAANLRRSAAPLPARPRRSCAAACRFHEPGERRIRERLRSPWCRPSPARPIA